MTALNSLERPAQFPALTGLRALAAALVFWHHFNPFQANGSWAVAYSLVREFHIGVSIFFTLSGFLIAHRYANQEFSWRLYLISRVARVLPLYFLITTLTFVFTAGSDWSVYWLNMSLLRGFFDDLKFSLVSQGWSLTVEECFYLLAPFLFVLVAKNRSTFMLIAIFLIFIGLALVWSFSVLDAHGFFKTYSFMFTYTFFGRCFEFLIGVALAIHLNKKVNNISYTWLGLLSMLVMIMLITFMGRSDSGSMNATGIVLNNFFLPVTTALLIYGLITEKTWVSDLLSTAVLQVLGKASYAFYLIHLGVISLWLSQWMRSPLLFLALQGCAVLLWWLVEDPLRRLILRLVNRQ
jgi:peptidoglycan/LPS O-acetylase OafA/YrhL